jgi:hypothetical protein
MKTLTNKKTEIEGFNDSKMTYADLAKICINVMPQGGLDVTEMIARLKVTNKLEEDKTKIDLEDAEAETLKACVTSMKWTMMHQDLVDFIQEVDKL